MLLPSGVSSPSEASSVASARCWAVTPVVGKSPDAWRLPNVMVPVLSSNNTSKSPAASTARPDVAITLARIMRPIPATPIADSSPPMVVGMRHTSSATSTVIVTGVPAFATFDAVDRIRQQRDRGEQEHQRHRHQQYGQRDLVRRLVPLGALDHADHAIEEGLAGIDVDAHDNPVGEHARTAGHRVEVTSRGPNHRSALARDRALVDRRGALDHLAVAGNEVALHDQNDIALAQAVRRCRASAPRLVAAWRVSLRSYPCGRF